MASEMEIPDFDPRIVQSVMKLGGKKRLDALMAVLSESGPLRLQDLKEARTKPEARAAAQALKGSAGGLGLAALEDLCDQMLNLDPWPQDSDLPQRAEQAFARGNKALSLYRVTL